MEVSLASQTLFNIGSVVVTNSTFTAMVLLALFTVFALLSSRSFAIVPTRVQLGLEMLSDFMLDQLRGAFGSEEKARKFYPLIMSLLLFIVVANQFSIVPLVSNILVNGNNLFRLPTSDLTLTITLSFMVLVLANGIAFSISPLRHIGKFIRVAPLIQARSGAAVAQGLLDLFLGILDIIGELGKLLSLAFRLFGNIFAGELMVGIIASLSVFTSFIVPIPFIVLSMFSGVIQAFVFVFLTIQFIAGSISDAQGESE